METRLARHGSPVFAVVSGETVWLRSRHGMLRLARSGPVMSLLADADGWSNAPESLRRALAAHGVGLAATPTLEKACPSPVSVSAALAACGIGHPAVDIAAPDDASTSSSRRPCLVYLHAGCNVLVGFLTAKSPCPQCLRIRLRATYPFTAAGQASLGDLLDPPTRHVDPDHEGCAVAQGLLAAVVAEAIRRPETLLDLRLSPIRVRPRPVLPVPNCPGCPPSGRGQPAPRTERRDGALPRYLGLVDARTGVVAGVFVRPHAEVFEARTWTRIDTRQFSSVRAYAGGAAVKPSREEAIVAALGEAYERYAAGVVRRDLLYRARFTNVAGNALDPRYLQDVTLRRTPERFDVDRCIEWVAALPAEGGPSLLVPAAAAYLPYPDRLVRQSSIGLAAATSLDAAAHRGLREWVERFSWQRAWSTRAIRTRLDIWPCCIAVARLLRSASEHGSSVWAADITAMRGTRVVVAGTVAHEAGGRPLVAMGLGAGATLHDAAIGALCEVIQSQIHVSELLRTRDVPLTAGAVRTMDDRYLFYCHPARLARLAFLRTPGDSVMIPHQPVTRSEPGTVHGELVGLGLRALVVDLTPADLRAAGVHVARVLVAAERWPIPLGDDLPPSDWPPPGC